MSLDVRTIERPDPALLKLYILRSLAAGPAIFIVLPVLFFRYQTLRYRFEDDGVSMSFGLLFRREVHLAYDRIQDIHLSSGILERYFGVANLAVQTASGSAGAEMTLEGLRETEAVRDFLYAKMRGRDDPDDAVAGAGVASADAGEATRLLDAIAQDLGAATAQIASLRAEVAALRAAVEPASPPPPGGAS